VPATALPSLFELYNIRFFPASFWLPFDLSINEKIP
jgi:hypothetical protein